MLLRQKFSAFGFQEDLKRDSAFISLCLWSAVPLCEAVGFWRLSGDAGKADILKVSAYTSEWFGFPGL